MTDPPTPPTHGPSGRTEPEAVSMAQLIARSSLGARDAQEARARVRVQDARQVMARAASIRHRKSGG